MLNRKNDMLKILLMSLVISSVFPVYYMKYAERSFEVEALDPINAETTWRQLRFNTFVQGRLWFKNDKMQNVPDIAESLPVQSNLKETIITIKENARWQDGQAITAADVVFSFELYRDCEIPQYSYIANQIVVEQIDEKSFRIKQPEGGVSSFWYYVTDGIAKLYILPKHIIGDMGIILPGDDFSKRPLGAGAFKIENVSKQGSQVILDFTRNPYYYYDEYASSEKIKEVSLVTEPLMFAIVEGLKKDNEASYDNDKKVGKKKAGLDLIVEELSSISNLELLRTYSHIRSKTYEKNRWTGLAINTRKELLDNKEFRILLDEMIDAREIMKRAYDEGARPITGPFHPSFGIQKEGLMDRASSDMSIIKSTLAEDFNVKDVNGKLQVLDKNTGEYKPLEFTIIYNKLFVGDGSREQDALEQIKQKFESYGISIILDGNSREGYIKKLTDNEYWDLAFDQKEFPWNNDIWPIFDKNNTTHNGNVTGYSNPVLTDLLYKFYVTPNPRAKQELGEQIHQHCYDNVPYLFLWSPEPICFYRDVLRDLSITPMEFFSTSRDWGVENRQ